MITRGTITPTALALSWRVYATRRAATDAPPKKFRESQKKFSRHTRLAESCFSNAMANAMSQLLSRKYERVNAARGKRSW